MELPEIGHIVTTEGALELCKQFKLDYLVKRIEDNRDGYKNWKFDGCSGVPDKIMGLLTGCNWRDITYKCCLPHDLGYAYGEKGNKIERKRVDQKFYSDLLTKVGMIKCLAFVYLALARVGGHEALGLSFSWGFANKD